MRVLLRARHYSSRTEEACVQWARRFILFHGKRHPSMMGAPEINEFLSWLAVERNVAASTQNQALSALLYLYREVLGEEVPWLAELVRARRPERLPAVLTRDEVRRLLGALHGTPELVGRLLHGTPHACPRGLAPSSQGSRLRRWRGDGEGRARAIGTGPRRCLVC
jgi:integrase